ncbi:cupin domain-containing protein [Pseudomonas sp. M30-35]|uniref:cupin domain-containing protein n=1 Tax=Pseudomonas sp. M30-35 TaxID=1981174 RepID=UPI000B3BF1FA|nr:cupin domain-containing protein [Pseudomonas sp. M30-35]ARU89265.1 cupin [Pseudomonas sp. M30-35]
MRVNDDLTARVVVDTQQVEWLPSPLVGVERRPLERVAAESGRTTSVVRYAPGSSFRSHLHPGGEEVLVLEGVFADEYGEYPAGYWLKNPPGSRHAPSSASGCLLFVKLCYQALDDQTTLRINTRAGQWREGLVEGLSVLPLDSFGTVHTALVRWAPGTRFNAHRHFGGEEILVLEGVFQDEFGDYPAGTWLRNPHNSQHRPFSTDGCLIYVKVGHLDATDTGNQSSTFLSTS